MRLKLSLLGFGTLTLIAIAMAIYFLNKEVHLKNTPNTAADLISQGNYALAHDLLIQSETNPDSLTSKQSAIKHIQLALCEQALDRPKKAIEYLSKIPSDKIPEVNSYLKLWEAKALIDLERYVDAELILQQAIDSTNNPFILKPKGT